MNVLLIASRDPRGPSKGRKVVLRTIIRSLTVLGHAVTVVAFGKREEAVGFDDFLGARIMVIKAPGPTRILLNAASYNLSRRMSLNECLYFSPAISRRINQLVTEWRVQFVVADMIRTAEYAARTGVPWFVDLDDLLSQRYESWRKQGLGATMLLGYYGEGLPRLPRVAASWLASWLLRWEAKVLKRREIDVAVQADGVSLVSEPEARQLAGLCGRPVAALPMAVDVPQHLAVDTSRRPMKMAFSGALDYQPNLDAISYYATRVVPVLRAHGLGHLCLDVFGHCPDATRKNLESAQLRFQGYVDDLHGALAGYQLFLAPLRSGSGVKTKIVEAMLLGLPVVTTPIGTQGLDVYHAEQCYIWRSTDELVDILHEMHTAPAEMAQVARAGTEYALQHFTPAVITRLWEQALFAHVYDHCGPLADQEESTCETL